MSHASASRTTHVFPSRKNANNSWLGCAWQHDIRLSSSFRACVLVAENGREEVQRCSVRHTESQVGIATLKHVAALLRVRFDKLGLTSRLFIQKARCPERTQKHPTARKPRVKRYPITQLTLVFTSILFPLFLYTYHLSLWTELFTGPIYLHNRQAERRFHSQSSQPKMSGSKLEESVWSS